MKLEEIAWPWVIRRGIRVFSTNWNLDWYRTHSETILGRTGSSQLILQVHSCCITCFVRKVLGDNSPNGSNTQAMSDWTNRFVGLVNDSWALKEKVSANGSLFKPSSFKSESSSVLNKTEMDIAWGSGGTICKMCTLFWPTFGAQFG